MSREVGYLPNSFLNFPKVFKKTWFNNVTIVTLLNHVLRIGAGGVRDEFYCAAVGGSVFLMSGFVGWPTEATNCFTFSATIETSPFLCEILPLITTQDSGCKIFLNSL